VSRCLTFCSRINFITTISFFETQLLKDTGTPQTGTNAATEHIGPMPNLANAYTSMTTNKLDVALLVDLSGSFRDDLPNFKSEAPNVITRVRAKAPDSRFGLASFIDYPFDGYVSLHSHEAATCYNTMHNLKDSLLHFVH